MEAGGIEPPSDMGRPRRFVYRLVLRFIVVRIPGEGALYPFRDPLSFLASRDRLPRQSTCRRGDAYSTAPAGRLSFDAGGSRPPERDQNWCRFLIAYAFNECRRPPRPASASPPSRRRSLYAPGICCYIDFFRIIRVRCASKPTVRSLGAS